MKIILNENTFTVNKIFKNIVYLLIYIAYDDDILSLTAHFFVV